MTCKFCHSQFTSSSIRPMCPVCANGRVPVSHVLILAHKGDVKTIRKQKPVTH